ncbi:glycosyltransferase family 2 protein [Halorientalis pallida]|uniref:glycosyltransferase family 2 protein n=1 Tax=Halorientalis pallida TaxID=2479928 RepID=UPI003C6FC391
MTDHPELTVGIPTVGREYLAETLQSVETAATAYDGTVSVVVASAERPRALDEVAFDAVQSAEWVETAGSTHENRQAILETSGTEWVLFTDDDCRVARDVFTAYAEGLAANEDEDLGALYGRVKFVGERSPVFDAGRALASVPFDAASHEQTVEWAPTANALLSRSAALSVGGFDTENPIPFSGGDVDIGLRLTEGGYTGHTCPNAVVEHTTATWDSLGTNTRRFFRYGQSEAWLANKYPGQRIPKIGADETTPGPFRMSLAYLGSCVSGGEDGTTNPTLLTTVLVILLAVVFTVTNSVGYHYQVLASVNLPNRLLFHRFRPEGRYL